MKLREMGVLLAMTGVLGVTNAIAADTGKPPMPKLERTISLGHVPLLGAVTGKIAPIVKKMSFSPDGRYLGLVEATGASSTDIVIWDVEGNKEQARIHCKYNYAALPWERLLWLHGGKVVTFGAGSQWDAMSGQALPDNPARGGMARLNKDGTKMLTVFGPIGDPSTIYVYDTKTWAEQKIGVDGLEVGAAVWTADDKIMVTVGETADSRGKTVNGHEVRPYDTAIRLIDPAGKTPTHDVWFAGERTGNPQFPLDIAFPVDSEMEPNFVTNQIFLDSGRVIDGATLAIRHYESFANDDAPGAMGMAVSSDGKWLYLRGVTMPNREPTPNEVVDAASGKPMLRFTGGNVDLGAIAASSDGKWLAIGDEHSMFLFSVN
ncbi:WD40 repeat domain-containing protein [Trinickia acidisoli]|uniref:WD40 repeat domain-containing protein n=1 Tax=Trinickia acidisoli TaxID=2767482 RepID=UPI001A8C4AA0|nr:hypothetical protein [Trinickia acidisoli]